MDMVWLDIQLHHPKALAYLSDLSGTQKHDRLCAPMYHHFSVAKAVGFPNLSGQVSETSSAQLADAAFTCHHHFSIVSDDQKSQCHGHSQPGKRISHRHP